MSDPVPGCIPVWSFKLRHHIRPGLVTLGKYDGVHDSLTCATDGGKVWRDIKRVCTCMRMCVCERERVCVCV